MYILVELTLLSIRSKQYRTDITYWCTPKSKKNKRCLQQYCCVSHMAYAEKDKQQREGVVS